MSSTNNDNLHFTPELLRNVPLGVDKIPRHEVVSIVTHQSRNLPYIRFSAFYKL
jgi:hypothetical protein